MAEQRSGRRVSRRRVLHGVGTAALAGVAGCTGGGGSDSNGEGTGGGDGSDGTGSGGTAAEPSGPITVFHAGSLAPPFSAAEPKFESETGIDVSREAKGSVASTKKITVQGRSADVLGVSDFRLLRNRLLPDYGDWYAVFTTNAMSIQYREDSPGADEIGEDNWWEVLARDGVTIGHADPAIDPGGYRAVMTQQLGKESFRGERLYDETTYEKLRANSTVPTGTETNLEGQLKSGKLDYVFYYRSIATSSDLPSVDLQPQVDLSKATAEYASHYSKANVETDSGTFTGAPIAYGITVPSVAENPVAGARWVEYMLTDPGRTILEAKGLVPVETPVVPDSGSDAVPSRVMRHAEARSSLGPLEL